MMIRALLDNHVVVNAVIKPSSIPGRIVRLALLDAYRLVWSRDLIDETMEVLLTHADVHNLISRSDEDIKAFISTLELIAEIPSFIPKLVHTVRDADDAIVLDCALAAKADYIVSGDKDILVLQGFQNVRILPPRDFLTIIETEQMPWPE